MRFKYEDFLWINLYLVPVFLFCFVFLDIWQCFSLLLSPSQTSLFFFLITQHYFWNICLFLSLCVFSVVFVFVYFFQWHTCLQSLSSALLSWYFPGLQILSYLTSLDLVLYGHCLYAVLLIGLLLSIIRIHPIFHIGNTRLFLIPLTIYIQIFIKPLRLNNPLLFFTILHITLKAIVPKTKTSYFLFMFKNWPSTYCCNP